MSNLQKFKEETQEKAYGKHAQRNRDKGFCISCKELAIPNCYSVAGRKEFKISGLCEKCFDKLFI
jgi:hypothetical protein